MILAFRVGHFMERKNSHGKSVTLFIFACCSGSAFILIRIMLSGVTWTTLAFPIGCYTCNLQSDLTPFINFLLFLYISLYFITGFSSPPISLPCSLFVLHLFMALVLKVLDRVSPAVAWKPRKASLFVFSLWTGGGATRIWDPGVEVSAYAELAFNTARALAGTALYLPLLPYQSPGFPLVGPFWRGLSWCCSLSAKTPELVLPQHPQLLL